MASKELSNESEYETDREKKDIPKMKRSKKYKQKFLDAWLANPLFKTWLKKKTVMGRDVPFCAVCNVKITCAKSAIVRHGDSKAHQESQRKSTALEKSQPSSLSAPF